MKTLIINQKMSGTGTIHDIASQHYAREIYFKKGEKYTVVLASYYGDISTNHKTSGAAAKKSALLCKRGCESHEILDPNGDFYTALDGDLVKRT